MSRSTAWRMTLTACAVFWLVLLSILYHWGF